MGTPSPDELLRELQDAAGEPPLVPLRISASPASTRGGFAGTGVNRLRAALLRLLSPVLGDLLVQLERDRHRQRGEIMRLNERIDALERNAKNPQ